jgi:CO/xanthine dehydrogenase FAD-binding subunit
MKPFDYYAATSIKEAINILNLPNQVTRPLAGGTDLLVQLRHDLKQVDAVVDIKKIPELNQLSYGPVTGLTVGAAVNCAKLCAHPDVQTFYPGLVDAASIIGGTAIQSRATLGGNLCNAAPSGDSIALMIVLKAECMVTNADGSRMIPVEKVCTNPGTTVLQKGDLLVSIHFPVQPAYTGAAYLRFTPRREMDIAIAGAGVWILLGDQGDIIKEARIALSAVAPTPLLVPGAAELLIGNPPDEETFNKAAEAARMAAQPITDMRGTKAQRRHLVGVLVKRALQQALQRAIHKSK